MFSSSSLFLIGIAYFAFLGLCGNWAEKRATQGRDPTRNGLMYTLSLTVYCTSWSFFGSVGSAAESGMLFSAFYLGPTLMMFVAWGMIRRLIRLRKTDNISSVADLIAVRYGSSVPLGMFITLALMLGMIPYIGLQLRTMVHSVTLLAGTKPSPEAILSANYSDELFILLIALLTCLFGLRRVDLHRRQTGMLAILAVESVVKLVAFLAVGLFILYGLFDGLGDLYTRLSAHSVLRRQLLESSLVGADYLNWVTYLLLSMGAVLLLPHMFHVMVVENDKERHLGTAVWLLPLYLLAISFFVMPIVAAGQLLGYPITSADWFMISLPLDLGGPALTLLAYLGALSAAAGMAMVACANMAMMFSNYIVLPLLARLFPQMSGRISTRQVRWATVFGLIWLAFQFQRNMGNSVLLIQIGTISLASVIQFAPALLGALYWRRGNGKGAWWGLVLGWSVWFYTLFLPALLRSVSDDLAWLTLGPWGVSFLRPEALFGLDLHSTMFNSVFWSLLFNAFAYVTASLLSQPKDSEFEVSQRYLDLDVKTIRGVADAQPLHISAQRLWTDVRSLLTFHLPELEASQALADIKSQVGIDEASPISGEDFINLTQAVVTRLTGAIGGAMAHKAVTNGLQLPNPDALRMQAIYARKLAELNISPLQLRERVDYFHAMTKMAEDNAAQLKGKLHALEVAAEAQAHADASLRESENRFRTLADSAPVMIWMTATVDGPDYFNQAWTTFTGRATSDQSGADWTSLIHPDDVDKWQFMLDEVMEGMTSASIQFRMRHSTSAYRWLGAQIMPRISHDRMFLGLIASAIDITDLKEAEAVLRQFSDKLQTEVDLRTKELMRSLQLVHENEETIRAITDAAQDAVIMLDAQGEVTFWNKAAEHIFGWSTDEVLYLPLDRFLIPERSRAAHVRAYRRFQSGEPGQVMNTKVELTALTKQGIEILVELSLSSTTLRGELHAVGMLRDITERKAAEAALTQRYSELQVLNKRLEEAQGQLLQSEKMASIGQLAAGVAHEINNPIGFVSSNLRTLRSYSQQMLDLIAQYEQAEPAMQDAQQLANIRTLKDNLDLGFVRDDLPALLTESEDGLNRVKKIVQDLKDFSHVNESEWLAADINAGLDATLNVVWNEIKYKATVNKHYGQLPLVECLASQLNQVFMNLLVNAVQAIEEQGTITITTTVEGDGVLIEVRDTGKGMTEEVKTRIFDPFFTTKPVGKGTGLGLSLSFGIIKKHRGRIEVESARGEGSAFRVWVPIKRPPAEEI